ncbi:hypothetical protein PshuTeo2_05750 [Pseudomonas hunanensis]|uniref:hypothetical protein n=1 Tax=Pseudomonas hunanensis TaxID=1247546 RepID=UPI002AA0BCC8|nr:hypothetical protein [Pseudomonas hunanensis]MDY7070553.1 hypothetical protein [Pseudomonas hunanensis]
MGNVEPKHEPLPTNSSKAPWFLDAMGSSRELQSVERIANPLQIGRCYWNVDAVVEKWGGNAIYGWDVSFWPDSHIVAMHHAIWQSPDGNLYDVTDTYSSVEKRSHSTFLPDDSIDIDLQIQPCIAARYFAFGSDKETADFIAACSQSHKLEHEISRIAHRAGYRCEVHYATARGLPEPDVRLNFSREDDDRCQALIEQRSHWGFRIGTAIVALIEAQRMSNSR